MKGLSGRIPILLVLASSVLVLIAPVTGLVRYISAFLLLFYVPGFLILSIVGFAERPRLDDVFIPFLISPIIVSIAVLLLHGAGFGLRESTTICGAAFAILGFWACIAKGTPANRAPSVDRSIYILSAAIVCMVGLLYIANRFLIIRSDAWFHGCVVSDIIARGIPPMEPGFPDVPIRYMWIYHVFNAAWRELSGLSVFPALAVFNVVCAFIFPYLVARLASIYFPERRYVLAAAILAVMGLESATWILWPLNLTRALTGHVKGAEEVARIIGGVRLNDAAVIDSLRLPWTWMVSLPDKLITITAFGYALALFMYAFIIARSRFFATYSSIRCFLNVFIPMLGALLFHIIVGTALALTAIGAALLALFLRCVRRAPPISRRHISILLAAAIGSLAVCIPYFRTLLGGGSPGGGIEGYVHFGFRNILTIVVPLLVLYPASKRAVRRMFEPVDPDGWMLLLWLAPLAALNVVVNLPTVNESKLVFPLFLLVIPFMARELAGWYERTRKTRRGPLAVWFAMLFAVPFVLTIRGFYLDRPESYCEKKRFRLSSSEREIYSWMEKCTPIGASVITRATCNLMPVYANRRGFVPSRQTIFIDGYAGPQVDLYARLHENLFSGQPDLATDLALLAGTGNDYYIVLWREDAAADSMLEAQFAENADFIERTFENDTGVIYSIRKAVKKKGADG